MNIIIYHRKDYDGLFSALIAKSNLNDTKLVGYDYGDNINVDFQEGSVIYIVDVSLGKTLMKELKEKYKIIWIDHHYTAIKDSIEFGYSDLEGIRETDKGGACRLVWDYFNNGSALPKGIELISDYDVWNKKDNWVSEVVAFQYGLKAKVSLSINSLEKIYKDIIEKPEQLIEAGSLVYEYDRKRYSSEISNSSFPIKIGSYNGLCIITPDSGSLLFESVINSYDLFLSISYVSKADHFKFTLCSGSKKIDLNVGEYIKEHIDSTGGGHPAIGGGRIGLDKFIDLLKNKSL